MMVGELKYGTGKIAIDFPRENCRILEPVSTGTPFCSDQDIQNALETPLDAPKLNEFLEHCHRLLVVVSDGTRNTASARILGELFKYLNISDINNLEIKINIARGIHRPPTENELNTILGETDRSRFKLRIHDPLKMDELVFVGTSRYGNELFLNEDLVWAQKIIVIGAIGFHYFAGFSGGRKSILPGLASAKTIKANHNLIFHGSDGFRNSSVRTASLENNPIHLEMLEAVHFVGCERIFAINTILDSEGNLQDLVCGHIERAHETACRQYLQEHQFLLDKKADLVIASAGGHPRDMNMIQSHKAMEMASYAVREGGVIMLLAQCADGLGHEDFAPWFKHKSIIEFKQELIRNYVIYGQTALALYEKACRYRVYLCSDLHPSMVREMGLIPVAKTENIVHSLRKDLPDNFHTVVLPEAALTYCRTDGS